MAQGSNPGGNPPDEKSLQFNPEGQVRVNKPADLVVSNFEKSTESFEQETHTDGNITQITDGNFSLDTSSFLQVLSGTVDRDSRQDAVKQFDSVQADSVELDVDYTVKGDEDQGNPGELLIKVNGNTIKQVNPGFDAVADTVTIQQDLSDTLNEIRAEIEAGTRDDFDGPVPEESDLKINEIRAVNGKNKVKIGEAGQ